MKSSSAVFRALSIALLAAVVLYFGVQGCRYLTDPYSTTLAYRSSSEESISLTGWLVRDEEPLQGPSGTLQQMLREGEKAAAGETVVTVYSDAGSRIREQELQLEQLQFALESYLDSDAALKLDSSITDSILTLRGELADGDYSTASENVSALKAAILKRSHSYSSSEEIQSGIDQVKSELSRLRASLSGAVSVRAEKPGIYSAACDGYEDVLTPDTLADLTVIRGTMPPPSRMSRLRSSGRGRASRFALPRDWMPTRPRRFTPSERTRAGGSCWFCVATAICRRRPSCAISRQSWCSAATAASASRPTPCA